MKVVHLTDSPFYGGPERQMLGLSVALPPCIHTTILCFRDHQSGRPFLEKLEASGIAARMIGHSNPRFLGMVGDVVRELRHERANLLVCHGYKAGVIGWFAARRVGIPVIAVSRGWTAHTLKVRAYETLDRTMLQRMAGVVCVSAGQAAKVARTGLRRDRLHVIHNSVDPTRFRGRDAAGRAILEGLFPTPPGVIIVAVGRLSPEKGFDQLVEAARTIVRGSGEHIGIVLIGDGPDRRKLEKQVVAAGLESTVAFAGFRTDVDRLLPSADILVQSSYTEGLPNVVLEAYAAGIPVVATDVGGTGEIIDDRVTGFLVRPGDPAALARRIIELAGSPELRQDMGERGRSLVRTHFSFARQANQYHELFVGFLRSADSHRFCGDNTTIAPAQSPFDRAELSTLGANGAGASMNALPSAALALSGHLPPQHNPDGRGINSY